jgi:hypothetical protein
MVPVGFGLYLLLVRLRAPAILPGTLALLMAVCVGWNWPAAISISDAWHRVAKAMRHTLRHGHEPLSGVAERFAPDVGYESTSAHLLENLLLLRESRLSVFSPSKWKDPVPGLGRPLTWEAEAGALGDGLRLVADARATWDSAVEAGPGTRGRAVYEVAVPADGCYALCCRLRPGGPAPVLGVQVDERPAREWRLVPGGEYHPYRLEPGLDLSAGRHRLAVAWGTGMRLDVLELIPCSRGPARR